MINVCNHCNQSFGTKFGRQAVACDDCANLYHQTCWETYEYYHGHGCRVCVEAEAEESRC